VWIKLDFTPFFVRVTMVALALVAIGVLIRSIFPRVSWIGTSIIVVGAIPALLSGFVLISERVGDWVDKRKNRTSIEELMQDREIQGIRLLRGTKIERNGKLMSK
jgi:hypothetical protein